MVSAKTFVSAALYGLAAAEELTPLTPGEYGSSLVKEPELMVEWSAGGVDFAWDAAHTKEAYVKAGNYIKKHNCVAGLKVDPSSTESKTTLYITIPRWVNGVPSTLNYIDISLNEDLLHEPVLKPWPTWEWNAKHTETGNCDGLQNIQSMEIDANGLMWVIDVGRLHQFQPDADNTCPPKLVVFDTKTGKQVGETYVFPEEVVSRTASFLNDIVIDTKRNVAYISNTAGTGTIVLFDRTARKSYKFADPASMAGSTSFDWTIAGVHYAKPIWNGAPEDGIALTPDFKTLFFSPLTEAKYSFVSTESLWKAAKGYDVEVAGLDIKGPYKKSSTSDGMTFGCDGSLFYGGLTDASVYVHENSGWKQVVIPGTPERLFAHNKVTMNWVDTFAWGPDGAIWYTTNHLDVLFGNGVGGAGTLHIFRAPKSKYVKGSYIYGPCWRNTGNSHQARVE